MNKRKLYAIIGCAAVIIAVAVGLYYSIVYKTEISEFELVASASDAAGIPKNSSFTLKTTAPLTAQVIKKYLKVTPEVEVEVKKVAGDQHVYEIVPQEEFQVNKVYTIAIEKGPLASRTFSWAYQVKAPFAVVSSLPKDKGVSVPTNSGIEIDFNRADILNPEQFIEITPAVTGKFEVRESKVRFIPRTPLQERTVYTVKVKAGLEAKGTQDILEKDNVIQFETSEAYYGDSTPNARFTREFSEFAPNSDMSLGVYAGNLTSVQTTVYRFANADEYVRAVERSQGENAWALYYNDATIQFPESARVFSGALPLQNQGYYSHLIRLPQSLPQGYYVAVIQSTKTRDISWFQVHPVASFVGMAGTDSLVWLKNSATGQGISGAPVTYNGKVVGTTGLDGVVIFNTPEEFVQKDATLNPVERKFIVAQIPGGPLVIPVENQYGYKASVSQNDTWWDYISLNKNIYLPTDVVRFWTVMKPRQGEFKNKEITVALTNPYWGYSSAENIVTYAETKLKISDYSAVTGELLFANLKPGIYELTFKNGGEIVAKQTLSVGAYIKPAYKLSITPDKNMLFAGENVSFKVKAEFFDGTPVSNVSLSYSAYGSYIHDKRGDIKLNAQGEGVFTVAPIYSEAQDYWPTYLSVNVNPGEAEEGEISARASVLVFGPRIDNTIEQRQTADRATFKVKTRAVTLKNELAGEPYWNTESYLGAPVSGISTEVEVKEVVYLREEKGTGYDPINKLTYPIYEYRTEERPFIKQTIIGNASGEAEFNFAPELRKTYKITFLAIDHLGRQVKDTRYIYGGWTDASVEYGNSTDYRIYNSDSGRNYKIGDLISLQIQTYSGVSPLDGPNKYLFLFVSNGKLNYVVQNTPRYTGIFEDSHVPNVGVWPVWFANGRFNNAYLENLSFDANEKRLNVEVTKNKQRYAPGEEVNVEVKVTDKNGRPVSAEVNLSALDEAVFSIRPDEKDFVNDLYRDIFSPLVVRTSHMPPYGGGGAEKGGGDGDTPRSNIQEMAIFKSVLTDSQGRARVSFKLPDNLTSWRLTSQAITKDLSAGKSIGFIPVSLPFFVDATLNKTYLAGDELTLRLRSFGTSANQGDVVYTIESESLPFKKIERMGGSTIELPLGKLTVGKHLITVRAKNAVGNDALVREITVLDSYFSKRTSAFFVGKDNVKIQNPSLGYTTVVFSSLGKGQLYNDLKGMSYWGGLRIDQVGARMVAAKSLNQHYGEKNELPELVASKYQDYTGGIQLLPYSSPELELSALAAHLFDETVFDRQSLKRYFQQSLADTKTDASRVTRALYGLAAFGEPVLTRVQSMKDEKVLGLKDKIYVALALDALGAKEEARSYYKETVKPAVNSKGAYAFIDGLKGDETVLATTLAAALTASLEEPESAKLALYAREHYPAETLHNFERLLYAKLALPTLNTEDVTFTYDTSSKNGAKKGTKTLKNGELFELTLSPEEVSGFKLSAVKGELGIVTVYEEPSTPASIQKDNALSLTRQYYTSSGILTNQFNESDMVRVQLYPQMISRALNGSYQITDYAPSGLRPVDRAGVRYYDYYGRIYPSEINDQKVTFIVDKNNTLPVYYYARVVSKGTYKAEPALMQSVRNLESATISNAQNIIIK